jgi:hypothetical protein
VKKIKARPAIEKGLIFTPERSYDAAREVSEQTREEET